MGERGPKLEQPREAVVPQPVGIYSAAAWILICFLLATNVYRAANQSITIDEAFTYFRHVAAWRFWSFWEYTANNHVLNTFLSRLSIGVFGLSEFTLRLPSVLGGLLYLFAVYRLSRLLFGESAWMALSVAVNCLNPLILDFLSAARGYGMGLAFLCQMLFYCLRFLTAHAAGSGFDRTDAIKTGASLGLAVSAQLTYAVPGTAVVTVLMAVLMLRAIRGGIGWWSVARDMSAVVLPALLIAAAILVWPMRNAHAGDFYVGDPAFIHTLQSLVNGSLFYKHTVLVNIGFLHALFDSLPTVLPLLLVGLLAVAVASMISQSGTTSARKAGDPERLLMISGVLLVSWLLLAVAHLFVARPFPSGRTALYWLPLTAFACLLGLRRLPWIAWAGALTASVLVLQFALEFNPSYYWVYLNDSGVKRMMTLIRARHAGQADREVTIGASWDLSDSINFYRELYRMDWMTPVTRVGPDCNYEYYMLTANDVPIVDRYHLDQLYRDDFSGAVLAKRDNAALREFAAIFPPPIERAPPCGVDPEKLGPFVRLGPGTEPYIVRDIMRGCTTPWTMERPMLLFRVERWNDIRFVMHFQIPELVLNQIGPLSLSVWINGRRLAKQVFRDSGTQTFEHAVPPDFRGMSLLASAELRLDKLYVSPKDGAKLGILIVDAGFVPEGVPADNE